MAESTDGLSSHAREIFDRLQAKFQADIDRALQANLPDPMQGGSMHASTTVLTTEMLYEFAAKLQAQSALPDPFQLLVHPSTYDRLNPKPITDDGTDLRTVDRMANPHRPGTPEHTKWMKQWANVQPHFQTQAYLDEKARVEADQERMNETYGPMVAPGWADAVLAEIEEAREECEFVVDDEDDLRVFLDECVDDDYWADSWVKTDDVKVKLFTKGDPQRVVDISDLVTQVSFSDMKFTQTDDGSTDGIVRYNVVARLNAPTMINISVV